MKQCPVCKNTYTDETLQFCLADGATLNFSANEQPTEQFSGKTNSIRVDFPREEIPTIVGKKDFQEFENKEKKGKGWNLIYGLIIGFVGSAILALIFIGFIIWQRLQITENQNNTKPIVTNSNSQTQAPTPDELANLKNKIENLQKQVDQSKTSKPSVPTISNSAAPQTNKVTAKANSPGDGFLALRTGPSSETGDRIMKIPHGATLTVIECLPKAPGKNGRWCRVDYNGNVGWAFDGFMTYQ